MNYTFNELRLEQHPDKTLIGWTGRASDFLDYHFKPDKLSIAGLNIETFMGAYHPAL